MTAVEISNMSFEEKCEKVAELINTNDEAKAMFLKNAKYIGVSIPMDTFYGLFIASFAK